jgi:hypothetical protein
VGGTEKKARCYQLQSEVINMMTQYAPLIHVRTKFVDFRSGFLVQPENFTEEDVNWAKRLVLDSTRYFELCSEKGRRVVFSNGRLVVSGLTILIEELFKLCGKKPEYHRVDESQKRLAYGFIGVVLPAFSVKDPFDIPYDVFLETYLRYVVPRWEENLSEAAHEVTRAKYLTRELPKAAVVAELEYLHNKIQNKIVLNENIAEREGIAAYVLHKALQGDRITFCSDITLPKAIEESAFDIVTCKNADKVFFNMEQDTGLSKGDKTSGTQKKEQMNSSRQRSYIHDSAERYNQKVDKEIEQKGKRQISSLDNSLIQYSAPQSNVNVPRKPIIPLLNTRNEMQRKKANNINNIRANISRETKEYTGKSISEIESLEEKMERFSAPDECNPFDKAYWNSDIKNSQNNSNQDTYMALGIGAGVVITVVGLAIEANPVVLCASGIFTVVLSGIEAKRIIDRLNKE